MNILIVEDAPTIAMLLSRGLTFLGHTSDTISSRFHFLFQTEFWKNIDVAIIDIQLTTDISGIDVIWWLRRHIPEIITIVMTATPDSPDISSLLPITILSKPITFDDITKAIDNPIRYIPTTRGE